MQTRIINRIRIASVTCIALGGLGCEAGGRRQDGPRPMATEVNVPAERNTELERDLIDFTRFAEAEVTRTTDQIEAETENRQIRRAALMWKLEILGDMQEDLSVKEPPQMLVDSLALWVRVQQYLRSGEGKDLFGQWQTNAITATSAIVAESERLARKHVPDNRWPQIKRDIDAYAKESPIRGLFEHDQAQDFAEARQGRGVIEQVFGLPLQAVHRVGESLDPTSRLAQSVDRFREVADDYPQMVRWQLQLLMLDLEQLSTVQSAIKSMTQTAEAASRFSETAEQLPKSLRTEAQMLLDDVDSRQPELRKTLQETREIIDNANQALVRVDDVAKRLVELNSELTESGDAWRETAHAVKAAVEQIQQFGRRSTLEEKSSDDKAPSTTQDTHADESAQRPFDIRDYTQTADSLREATIELRLLLDEMNSFAEGEGIARGKAQAGALAGEVLVDTQSRLREVIDHAFWRAVQLAFVVAALIAVYQLVSRRMRID